MATRPGAVARAVGAALAVPLLVLPLLSMTPAQARPLPDPGHDRSSRSVAPLASQDLTVKPVARRAKGRQVGFSPGFSIVDDRPVAQRRQFARMRALGVRRVRLDVGWARVQQSPSQLDWADTDRVVEAAHAAGLQVLGVLSYEPDWARSYDDAGDLEDVDPDAFARFAGLAARRYRGVVSAWELWNEPNLDWAWGKDPDPAAYARLVEAAVPAVRAAAPRAGVVIGALAPAVDAEDGSQVAPETFLTELYATLSSPTLADAVSVHPYSYPAMPDGDEDWNTFHKLEELHGIVTRAGAGDARLWLTEYGAPTGRSDRAVSNRRQARMLVTALREARRLDFVGPVFFYSYRDSRLDPDDPEANFGVTRYGGRPKAAYWALRRALRPGTSGARSGG